MGQTIDKLAWVHVSGGRVLCARSQGKRAWYLPGGKREPGESDGEALAREIKEELSVELVRETLAYVGRFEAQADGKPEGTVVAMTCYRAEFRGAIAAAAEIEEVRWLGHRDRGLCSPVTRLVLDRLKADGSID
jgi:8-oxo-dGTP diphosphatase